MITVLKSLLAGAAIALFSPILIGMAYMLWVAYVSPGILRQAESGEVGWDLVTLFHNAPWLWFVEALIFLIATVLMHRYFANRRA